MMPPSAVPGLHPLTLPCGRRPLPPAADVAAEVFAGAERAYDTGRFADAGVQFLAAARILLDLAGPGVPDLSGARTVCYLDAILAALAADRLAGIDEVVRWVAGHDPACAAAVAEQADRLRSA